MKDILLFVSPNGIKVVVHSPTSEELQSLRQLQEDGAPLKLIVFFFCALSAQEIKGLLQAGVVKVISIDSSYGAPSRLEQIFGDEKRGPYSWFVCHGVDDLTSKLLETVDDAKADSHAYPFYYNVDDVTDMLPEVVD